MLARPVISVAVLLACLVYVVCGQGVPSFFVSPTGSDSAAGTLAQPFLTLSHARDALRAKKTSSQGGVIFLRGGVYVLASPLALGAGDGGVAGDHVIWQAYNGETVRIVGGVQVSNFTVYKGAIVSCDLKAHGLTDYGTMGASTSKMEAYLNGQPLNLARWPDLGNWTSIVQTFNGSALDMGFYTNESRLLNYMGQTDVWLHGYWSWDWADGYARVEGIIPKYNGSALTGVLTSNKTGYDYGDKSRYAVINSLSDLDQPGEYYIDRPNGVLYLWPTSAISEVWVSLYDNLIATSGTNHITFENLNFEYARQTAVTLQNGVDVTVTGCNIMNIGYVGLVATNLTDATISYNTIAHTGATSIDMSGGDRMTLAPGNIDVHNNVIQDMARWNRCYKPGIAWAGVGNSIRNNTISDGPHNAILGLGNDHLFEYNIISNFCYETSDASAFYTGRDWSAQGNILRYNTIQHVRKNQVTVSGGTVQGVYLDDQMSYWQILGNKFIDCEVGYFVGGGRENIARQNYFQNCTLDIHFDNRGMNWQKETCAQGGLLEQRLQAFNYQSPPWSVHYPWLVNIMSNYTCIPAFNVFEDNTYCDPTFIDQTEDTVQSWHSSMSNNVHVCQMDDDLAPTPTTIIPTQPLKNNVHGHNKITITPH